MTATTILAAPEVQNVSVAPPSVDRAVDAEGDRVGPDDTCWPVSATDGPLARARTVLERRAGGRAMELPAAQGRPVARLEAHLDAGPVPIDPTAPPSELVVLLDRLIRPTTAVRDLVREETQVLGDALDVDLSSFSLARMHELADAVLALSMAPRSASGWGQPDAAQAAETVLQVAAEDLRTSAREHASLYRRYTEYVWDVPTHLLQAGQRRWRFFARARLAQQLRAVSRTDRFPRGLAAAAKEILAVRAVRARLVSMSPLLTHHLAELDQGPLSDVDAALAAVGAVRRIQAALGEALVPDRLERLLLAEAFASPDVLSPAVNLRNAILAWRHDVDPAAGDACTTVAWCDVQAWVEACDALMPALREGQAAAAELSIPAPTLRALSDLLLLREHVQDLVDAGDLASVGGAA